MTARVTELVFTRGGDSVLQEEEFLEEGVGDSCVTPNSLMYKL